MGVERFPTTKIINRQGHIFKSLTGRATYFKKDIDRSDIEDCIDEGIMDGVVGAVRGSKFPNSNKSNRPEGQKADKAS